MPGKKKKYNARFPPARIKKIMQTDEEVGKVAAPVPVIISRALELFAETLLSRANDITTRRGARTLTPSHLKLCIETEGRFDFLRELVTNVPDLQEEEFEAEGDILPLQPRVSKPRSRGGIQAGGAPRERKSIDTVTQIPGSTQYMTQLPSNTSTQSMVRVVGRKRGRPPKANGSNGPGRPVEKRKYVDDDDDDDVQVIGSSDDNSRESNGVIVANPIYSRGAESSAFIQIDPVEIRPSSFSSHSFHPSLQHSFSYSNSPKVTPSGQFQNLVSPESRDTPDKAALTRVSCLARSLSSPAFSGLPSGWDNKVGYYPGNKSDRKLLNTEDEMKKSSGPSFSSDELSSTNMSNGPSSTPTCTTSSATNGPKHSIGLHTHGTISITGKQAFKC